MNDKLIKAKRTLKAVLIGASIGALILGVYIAPAIIQYRIEAAAAAVRQENLTQSRGEAFDSFAMADVSLTVLLNGKPREDISVGAGQGYWIVPQNGELLVSLAPNNYQFTAGYQNRKVTFSGEVFAEMDNEFVLDVDKAPSAPELLILDIPAGEDVTIPLEITNADMVTSNNLPEGLSIAKRDGRYILIVDGGYSRGFWCVKLIAENQYGQAFSYICLRTPRGEATQVYTAEDLDNIRGDLSGNYILMNDIDMSEIDDWTPIGTESYPFTGVFDGGGYEITGFHAPTEIAEGTLFGLFGYVRYAELRNTIFREPVITPEVPARDLNVSFRSAVLAATVMDSLIENCGSFGGIVSPSDGEAGGLLGGVAYSVVLDCFNSTEVFCNMLNRYLPNTGGISGGSTESYIARCANEGDVKGNHLSGGILGHSSGSDIRHCVNSGYIWGSTIVGAVPAGGVIQSNDGGTVGYSCFVRGQSAIGAHCSGGLVLPVIPIDENDLQTADKLPFLGSFGGESPEWAYASLDAQGPVPYGIFMELAPAPLISQSGNHIEVLPVDGVAYYYTVDGSDPYTNCQEPVRQLSLTLKRGQTLMVFAAQQGCRDSETIAAEGGS